MGQHILLVAEIIGALFTLGSFVVAVKKAMAWAKRITEGHKCQLRSDMLRIYFSHHEKEAIRQYEYEHFVYCYEAYKALGGNSFIDKIYNAVKTWEVLT